MKKKESNYQRMGITEKYEVIQEYTRKVHTVITMKGKNIIWVWNVQRFNKMDS